MAHKRYWPYLLIFAVVLLFFWPVFKGFIPFAFSSYMVVWIEYGNIASTLLWLPLILFFIKRIVQKTSFLLLLGLIVSLSCAILAGYIQGIFYMYIVSLAYALYLKPRNTK